MSINLYELFPEGISDETAFHLVEFFMSIATELDSHYFSQTRRYISNNMLFPECHQEDHNMNNFF